MCVILVCEDKRPTEEMVEKAWDWNDQGGGVAWIDGKSVRWKKGLTEGQMQDLCKTLPMPYVAHFRITSSGHKIPSLCHPFPIQKDASTALEGKTPKGVLFHNGTWGDWKRMMFESLRLKNLEMPEGDWNDTRALAFFAAHYGVPVLELIDEKTAVVTPAGIDIFGKGWEREAGILVSNKIFLNQSRTWNHGNRHGGSSGTDSRERLTDASRTTGTGGSSTSVTTFPARGSTVQRSGQVVLPGEDVEESVQETPEGVSAIDGEGEGGERQTPTTGVAKHAVDIALEALRAERLGNSRAVVLGPSVGVRRGLYSTPEEAAASQRQERQRRLDSSRRGVTYMGDM